jgi:hypothetical protein
MAIKLTAQGGAWERVYPDGSLVVCVEVGPNMYGHKRADELQAGDKVCSFGPPNPGAGLEIDSAEVV